jgi:hypothetical protein
LTEFGNLKKKQNESVSYFIKRFNKLYNKIPADVKPSQPTTKVTFAGSFDPDFSLFLRERRSTTLTSMQDDAVEIESNMIASGKARVRNESGEREKEKEENKKNKLVHLVLTKIRRIKLKRCQELSNIYQINWIGWKQREEGLTLETKIILEGLLILPKFCREKGEMKINLYKRLSKMKIWLITLKKIKLRI